MESAGKVYAQNPDPDTKLGELETMELSRLNMLQHRYKNIVSNKALLSRLKDRGESARRTLLAVEAELAARASGGDRCPPLEGRRAAAAAAEVDRLAQRVAQMEWHSGQRTNTATSGQSEELDSDDDPDPPMVDVSSSPAAQADAPAHLSSPGPVSPSGGVSAAVTRQLLPKSATSRREARFLTNRARAGDGTAPSPPAPGPPRRTVLSQWSDSALAPPVRPDTHTRLLDMDESLRLLTQHSRITQEERAAQLAARYSAVADIEGCHMEHDGAGSDEDLEEGDTGPAVIIGAGGGS